MKSMRGDCLARDEVTGTAPAYVHPPLMHYDRFTEDRDARVSSSDEQHQQDATSNRQQHQDNVL